jgi:hypothetical protein
MSNREIQQALSILKFIAFTMCVGMALLVVIWFGVVKMTQPATCHATSMTTQVCEFG